VSDKDNVQQDHIAEDINNSGLMLGNVKALDGVFEIRYIDPEDISVTKRIRKSGDPAGLIRSIREVGLLEPITVAPVGEGSYVLVHGLRRLNACKAVGMKKIPSIIGKSIKTSDVPVMASVYNQTQPYTNKEISDYVDYLLTERGIHDYNNIEYLLQLDTGDVAKLQDLKADNDPEIMSKFFSDELGIGPAFKKLEARRKKETKAEKLHQQAEKAYNSGEGLSEAGERKGIDESGETDTKRKAFNAEELDDNINEKSLDEMVSESDATKGFKPNKQKVGERERVDPTIKKATMARDNYTCVCCKRGGESYVDSLDFHHRIPVAFKEGEDSVANGVTLCVLCHRLVHLFGNGQLVLPKSKTDEELAALSVEDRAIYDDDQRKFKRVVMLGQVIRDEYAKKKIDRKKARELFPTDSVGRHKPNENLNSKELAGVEE